MTPPGGGIEPGESPADAVAREVAEEVWLIVSSASYLRRVKHAGGATSLYSVEVEDGRPTLGSDPELTCDCPRLVGMDWIPAPTRDAWNGDAVRSLLKMKPS